MRVKSLKIHHIGLVTDETIKLDKPLILFYGEIRQGKTTILNAVRWVCGGEFPEDIIQHGKDDAFIELELEDGIISRSWYRGKGEKKTVKARPVTFIRHGKPVNSPVSEIKRFLNPFLLNQDHVRNMNELERKKYFADLFAVDTTALDSEWVVNDRQASTLRIQIKAYGDIDLTPVERVDETALRAELKAIDDAYNAAVAAVDARNRSIIEHNSKYDRASENEEDLLARIAEIQKTLADKRAQLQAEQEWIKAHPRQEEQPRPMAPDTTALERKIQDAGAANVRVIQYEQNQQRAAQKKADEATVSKLEARQREIKREKQAKLKTISDTCGIADLAFDEEGNFTYQGSQAGMLSTSQIMRLSSELSALYPEGLGLELLDRAESLGKSIFEFVDRAKEEKKTILATIVGERPAKVPKNIGVFVVSNGKAEETTES